MRLSTADARKLGLGFHDSGLGKPTKRRKAKTDGPAPPSTLEALLAAQLHYAGLPIPTAQYHFARPRLWRFDLAYVDKKIAIEIHGGTWIQGRHVRGEGFHADRVKMNEAQLLGWMVLEFTEADVRNAGAVGVIERALRVA
jgi:hypothetical protein